MSNYLLLSHSASNNNIIYYIIVGVLTNINKVFLKKCLSFIIEKRQRKDGLIRVVVLKTAPEIVKKQLPKVTQFP